MADEGGEAGDEVAVRRIVVMRLLIDENVPESVTRFFRDRGHDVQLVRDVLLPGTPDAVVAAVGDRYGMIVVTWNAKDFKALAKRIPEGNRAKFRSLGCIMFKCPEPQGVKRLEKLIAHIELEYELVQTERDHRLFVEISSSTYRINR